MALALSEMKSFFLPPNCKHNERMLSWLEGDSRKFPLAFHFSVFRDAFRFIVSYERQPPSSLEREIECRREKSIWIIS